MNQFLRLLVLAGGIAMVASPSCLAQNLLRNGDHEIFIPKPSVPNPSDLCFRELYPFGTTPPLQSAQSAGDCFSQWIR
ncbi:MAG: hypothetical protein IPJ06_13750 [Saprospiraceae bacterium]|nr:hypothetical protein [Saprospiraceae bacterium]